MHRDDLVHHCFRTQGHALLEVLEHDWVHVFEFANGRIRSLKEYIDRSEVSVAFAP